METLKAHSASKVTNASGTSGHRSKKRNANGSDGHKMELTRKGKQSPSLTSPLCSLYICNALHSTHRKIVYSSADIETCHTAQGGLLQIIQDGCHLDWWLVFLGEESRCFQELLSLVEHRQLVLTWCFLRCIPGQRSPRVQHEGQGHVRHISFCCDWLMIYHSSLFRITLIGRHDIHNSL